MRFLRVVLIWVLTCNQECFAQTKVDANQKLQDALAASQKQVHVLEVPVFKNLKEIGFLCSSNSLALRDGKSLLELENNMVKRLRGAGLKVLEQRDADIRDPARPYLFVAAQSTGHQDEVEVIADLTEQAILKRNPKAMVILPTWRRSERLVLSNDSGQASQVESLVQKFVDEFIAQYLESNPQKSK
ncbi:MAG: hypothetical protein K2X81_28650 [Candidatus Obscuribacterales bacterium]|nr:hypothetical protein [Candidatus Obscuribacterales bacterium]